MDYHLNKGLDSVSKEEVKIPITVREAGRREGEATSRRHGRRFYQIIGSKGGKRTKELYADLLRQFGSKGGRPPRPNLDMGEEHSKIKEVSGRSECSSPAKVLRAVYHI